MQLAWSHSAQDAYRAVNKEGELEQIAAWCSLEGQETRRDSAETRTANMSSRPPGTANAGRRVLSWNCNRSCGTGAAIGHFARWVGKWIGVFSVAVLIEADSGFDQAVNPNWAEFTEHTVTERHRPLHSRTLRAVAHRDSRQASHVSPGDGDF